MHVEKTPLTAQQSKALAVLTAHEGWQILMDVLAARALEQAALASSMRLRAVGGLNQSLNVSAAELELGASMCADALKEVRSIAEQKRELYTVKITP